jgi:hypothetical protein
MFHAVVKLDPTRVMVIGGQSETVGINVCAIIDAERRTVRQAASLETGRTGVVAVKMSNGLVYAIGGQVAFGASGVSTVEVYDPATDSWSMAGYLTQGRGQVCATAINDHQIIIVGGRIGDAQVVKTCELFDIRTGNTTRIADFPYETSLAKVVVTTDGRILCFSGRSGGPGSFRSKSVHQYHVSDDVWTIAGEMEAAVYYPSVAQLDDGRYVLVGGSWREGNTTDEFATSVQVEEGSLFRTIANMQFPRAGHGVSSLGKEVVVALGGANNSKGAYRSTEFINVASGVVERGPDLQYARAYCMGVDVLVGGKHAVLAIGGTSMGATVRQVEILIADGGPEPLRCTQSAVQLVPSQDLLEVVGQALNAGPFVALNRVETYSAGAIWFNDQFSVSSGFETDFSFRLLDGDDGGYPDGSSEGGGGLAVIIQGVTPSPLGLPGAGLGYDQMVNGVAIEFDMYFNEEHGDLRPNHVAIQKGNGQVLRAVHEAPFSVGMSLLNVPDFRADGTTYYAKVRYAESTLSVWVDNVPPTGVPNLSVEMDLSKALSFVEPDLAWIGITGSTGIEVQSHEILSWDLNACTVHPHSIDRPGGTKEGKILIYPMPTSSHATIVFEGDLNTTAHVRVFSMTGELVMEKVVTGPTFDLSSVSIPVGNYILNIQYSDQTASTLWKVVR